MSDATLSAPGAHAAASSPGSAAPIGVFDSGLGGLTVAHAIMRHVHRIAHALSRAFDPSGLNVFQNNGVVAGQTVPHYHVHIVPSYPGDEPGRIFRSDGTERMERDELQKIADEIAAHLEPLPSGVPG